jgi:hypothetical protein
MGRGLADPGDALAAARALPGLMGMDLAKEATTREPYTWTQGTWRLDGQPPALEPGELPHHGMPAFLDRDAGRLQPASFVHGNDEFM